MGDIKLSMARIVLIFAGLTVFIRIVTEEFACVTDLTIATYAEFVTLYRFITESIALTCAWDCNANPAKRRLVIILNLQLFIIILLMFLFYDKEKSADYLIVNPVS